ncbi:MAG: hypothetical protein AAF581_22130 [Planctomycetota bacterium]
MRVVMRLSCVLLLACVSGCAFHSPARRWNGLVDPDGKPVYYVATTKVGANLLVVVPFLGDLGIDGLVEDVTRHIEEKGGDGVRIVQADSENYWYGWSPLTWFVSPVVATVAAEYRPSAAEVLEQQQRQAEEADSSDWYRPWSW